MNDIAPTSGTTDEIAAGTLTAAAPEPRHDLGSRQALDGDSSRSRPHETRGVGLVLLVALGIPFVAAAAFVITHPWFPSTDVAIIEARTWDTGSRLTPLVGPYSRLGWSHPGPLLFWLLALPYRLLGATTAGFLLGALLVNALAVVGCLVLARRVGGRSLVWLTALVLAVLIRGLGVSFLFSAWNPDLPVLGLAFLILATWAVIEDHIEVLPLAVVASCLAWQSHLGNLPVAGMLLATAVAAYVVRWRRPAPTSTRSGRRRVVVGIVTGAVLAVCLAPLVVDQLRSDPSNLDLIARSIGQPTEPVAGLGRALEVGAHHLAPNGAWLTGWDVGDLFSGEVTGPSPWALVPVLAAYGLAGALAVRARRWAELRLLALTGAVALVGLVAVSRTVGPVLPYLVNGLRAVAAMLWLAIAWALLRALPLGITAPGDVVVTEDETPRPARSSAVGRPAWLTDGVRRNVVVIAVVATTALSVASIWSGGGLQLRDPEASVAIGALTPGVTDAVGPRSVAFRSSGTGCTVDVASGLALQLIKHGNDVASPAAGFGSPREGRPAEVMLDVICGPAANQAALATASPPIATHDLVGSADAAELAALQARFRQQLHDAQLDDLVPAVDNGGILLLSLNPGPGFPLTSSDLARYSELIHAQLGSVAVFAP